MRRTHSTAFGKNEPTTKTAKLSKIVDLPLPQILTEIGSLLSCGQNEVGQLGFGEDIPEKSRPALLPINHKIVDICAGGMHSLYLTKEGDIYSFGCNDEGALGRDTSEEGSEYIPKKINLPGRCVKFSAGDSHSACLLEDGRVYAWGSFRDSHGSMGLTLEGKKDLPFEVLPAIKFVAISSGSDHLVLLTNTGKVYTIGCAEQGQLGRVSARTSSGETRRGNTQQLLPGLLMSKKLKSVDAIWTSSFCTFLRELNTGDVYAFGLNNYNQLGLGEKSDPVFNPRLTKFKDVKSINGGQHHTIVLTNENKCYAIGRKDYGRLGIPSVKEDIEVLTLIPALDKQAVTHICCGESCSFALTKDGKVYAWGMGTNNQLGTGSDEDSVEPTLLTGQQVKDKRIVAVSSGGQHSLFIVENNKANNETKTKSSTKSNGIKGK